LRSGCGHVSGLLVQPFFTTAGPDVVREVGPDHFHGLDTRDNKKVLPPRRPTDQHHAISTSATRDALRRVPLAAGRGDYPCQAFLSSGRARLGSILGGAIAGVVDAAVDHDGPGDPFGAHCQLATLAVSPATKRDAGKRTFSIIDTSMVRANALT